MVGSRVSPLCIHLPNGSWLRLSLKVSGSSYWSPSVSALRAPHRQTCRCSDDDGVCLGMPHWGMLSDYSSYRRTSKSRRAVLMGAPRACRSPGPTSFHYLRTCGCQPGRNVPVPASKEHEKRVRWYGGFYRTAIPLLPAAAMAASTWSTKCIDC